MDSFSYMDNFRAALAACLPCFASSPSKSSSATPPDPRDTSIVPSSSADLEHLLRDSDSDALSLHSNLGGHRRTRHRRRPKFSLTLFGYTLFGRPPIYLSDDEDGFGGGSRTRTLGTTSSSTLDSDAAPLDASTIERLTSPDHFAALAVQRQRFEAEEAARRKAERRARREERKARARAEALMSLTGSARTDMDTFEGFQGSEDGVVSDSFSSRRFDVGTGEDVVHGSPSDDADEADLGGGLYTHRKKSPAVLSASGSDSRSRTSTSFSAGDVSHIQNFVVPGTHASAPYPHTEMHLPPPSKKKPHRPSKRTSTVSSLTSQSTSAAPCTPVESIAETPGVVASPLQQERHIRGGERTDFPSVGLTGKRRPTSVDLRTFLAQ